MATTSDYLRQLNEDKKTLVDNLNSLGVQADYSQTFTSLVTKINESGLAKPTGTKDITSNGTYDVAQYEYAEVNVPKEEPNLQSKEVTPTKEVQEVVATNGYDGLSKVTVNPIPDDYIKPSGSIIITKNEEYDVTHLSSVIANVHESTGEQQYFDTVTGGSNSTPGILGALLDVPSNLVITNGNYAFYNCKKLSKIPALDYNNMTGGEGMFGNCTNLIDTTNAVNFTNATNFSSAFSNCTSLINAKLDKLNCSKLTAGGQMFIGCSNLISVDMSNLVCSLASGQGMFQNCKKLTTVTFNNSKFSNFYYGYRMFYECRVIPSIDLSSFYSSRTDLDVSEMFYNCRALQKLDIRNLDVSKITSSANYSNMLYNVPKTCEIIVMNDSCKSWFKSKFSGWTNVKTVAELGE